MRALRRVLWPLVLALAGAAALARGLWPDLLIAGRPAQAWATGGALALLGLNLAGLVVEALRGELPWTRLLLPAVLLLEGLGLAWDGGPRWRALRMATVVLLEVFLIIAALRILRRRRRGGGHPEEALAASFGALLPPRAARLVALEMVVLGGALSFLAGGHRRPDPPGHSYHREAVLGAFLPALPVLLGADLAGLEFLMRDSSLALRIAVHALDLYGLLWFTGLWASFRARPHRVDGDILELNHGFLGSLRVPRSVVAELRDLPDFHTDFQRLAFIKGAARLETPGPAQMELHLKEPCRPLGLLGPGKAVTRVILAVDDPEAFRRAVMEGPSEPSETQERTDEVCTP